MHSENRIVVGNRAVLGSIVVTVHDEGAISIEGPMGDLAWCQAVLAAALDEVSTRLQRERRALANSAPLIVMPGDARLPELPPEMALPGPR